MELPKKAKRDPVFAGQFYAPSKASLTKQVEGFLDPGRVKDDAIGVVSPHAGYIYSGRVAGLVFSSVKPKKTYIILGTYHTGRGSPFGISSAVSWKTPLGESPIDRTLADRIIENCPLIKYDELPHEYEHSIEVQLPFLQYQEKDFDFVPIVIAPASVDNYRQIGAAIARALKDIKKETSSLIIASSDMTHYESHDSAKEKDAFVIDAIKALDEELLVKAIAKHDISMCGYAPTAVMICAAKELGADTARLIEYRTSAEASGDYSSVVGYAGIVVAKRERN